MMSRKASFEDTPKAQNFANPFRGKTEYLRNFKAEESSDSQQFGNYRTIKTVNKLVDNNEVSVHESVGSFMSIEKSEGSEYQGALTKMGRSVDIMLPSRGHCMLQKKAIATSSNFNNKSFNNRW